MRLTTLKERHITEDLVEMYKAVNEQEEINWINCPKLRSDLEHRGPTTIIRGNNKIIRRESFNQNL